MAFGSHEPHEFAPGPLRRHVRVHLVNGLAQQILGGALEVRDVSLRAPAAGQISGIAKHVTGSSLGGSALVGTLINSQAAVLALKDLFLIAAVVVVLVSPLIWLAHRPTLPLDASVAHRGRGPSAHGLAFSIATSAGSVRSGMAATSAACRATTIGRHSPCVMT